MLVHTAPPTLLSITCSSFLLNDSKANILQSLGASQRCQRGNSKNGQHLTSGPHHINTASPKIGPSFNHEEGYEDEEASNISLVNHATSAASVSSFCQAVLKRIVPNECFGLGAEGTMNKREILCHVDHFIRMRKFETLSLHALSQKIKVRSLDLFNT